MTTCCTSWAWRETPRSTTTSPKYGSVRIRVAVVVRPSSEASDRSRLSKPAVCCVPGTVRHCVFNQRQERLENSQKRPANHEY